MYEVKCSDPVLKTALEEMLEVSPNATEGKIQKFHADVIEALETLPYAQTLLEQDRFLDLCGYLDELTNEFAEDTRLTSALDFFDKINDMLKAHAKNEPMNHASAAYGEWALEQGRLSGWLQSARVDIGVLRETFLEPHKKRVKAIAILSEIIHDHGACLEREIMRRRAEFEKLLEREDPKIRPLLRRVIEAKARGDPVVRFQVVKQNGETETYTVKTSAFFEE
jgi:hypothetical protein